MYTWEMIGFINKRNRYIGGDDLEQITSLNLNPQIKKIAYYEVYEYEKDGIRYKEHGIYKIEVKQDFEDKIEELWFKAMPYKEAKEKGLVKKK